MGESPDPVQGEMVALAEADQLLAAVNELTSIAGSSPSWIIVSNEVGMGLVPPYPLGRVYRDALGRVNQRITAAADEVWLMIAGVPWRLKPVIPHCNTS
jgi:adenosylcobinamide kinase/adenosylcobinamide-phosphate guanylyltransferase